MGLYVDLLLTMESGEGWCDGVLEDANGGDNERSRCTGLEEFCNRGATMKTCSRGERWRS